MVFPDADWKNQPRHILDWVAVVVAVVLLGVYLSLWWTDGGVHYFVFGMVFVTWLGVFFTNYWQPILYLVVALTVALGIVLMLLAGFWETLRTQAAILLNVVFLPLIVYLFFHEERTQ